MSYADQLARQRRLNEAAQNAANSTMVKIKADIQAQKTSWLIMLALNDEFQFGESRYKRLAIALTKRSRWYEKMVKETDEDYAVGKLKEEVERATRQDVEFAWEDELMAAKKRHENDILTNYERLRTNGLKKMAETLCGWLDCEKCPGKALCTHDGGKANGMVKWFEQLEVRE